MVSQKTPDRNTIIAKIHRTRERMGEKFGGDIGAIREDARRRQEASGCPVWKGPAADKASSMSVNEPTG